MDNFDNLFFIASKIAWAFLSPSNVLIFAFAVGVLLLLFNRIRAAKFWLIPTALISIAIMIYPLGDYVAQPLEKAFSQPNPIPKKIDGIILLGGAEDLRRSQSWQTTELGIAADRYLATAELAKQYPEAQVFFTGGNSLIQKDKIDEETTTETETENKDSEAYLSLKILQDMGVNKKRIRVEPESRNTYENFKFLKPKLDKKGTYLLVTSAFHMPRAVGIARAQNIAVIPYPVDFRSNQNEYRHFDIDFYDHLKALEPAWKEWIGLTVYFFTDKTASWFPQALPHDKELDISPQNQKTEENKKAP